MAGTDKIHADKFKDAARELECDDDDQRFKERLRKVTKRKPLEIDRGENPR